MRKRKNAGRRKRRVIGLSIVLLGLVLSVHLVQYAWEEFADPSGEPSRVAGLLGGAVAGTLWAALGVLSLLVPAMLVLGGVGILRARPRRQTLTESSLLLGIGLLLAAFLHALPGLSDVAHTMMSGAVGELLHALMVRLIGEAAALLLLSAGLLLVVVALIDFEVPGPGPIFPFLRRAGGAALALPRRLAGALIPPAEEEPQPAPAASGPSGGRSRAKPAKARAAAALAEPGVITVEEEEEERPEPLVSIVEPKAPARVEADDEEEEDYEDDDEEDETDELEDDDDDEAGAEDDEEHAGAPSAPRGAAAHAVPARVRLKGGKGHRYMLPSLDLLAPPVHIGSSITKDELLEKSKTLEAKLADFGVKATVTEVHPGPVITRYELAPAPGVKVNQIVNLSDDLALAMRAQRIRIVAPIPGKGAVGVEIPNEQTRTVYLREVLESAAFGDSTSPLSIGFGKDISGKSFVSSMEDMPHLLIAGATGSGKSVSMHVLISSILFKALPTEVRFLMIDPKMLELTVYNDIPHLIRPVITDPRDAAKGLRWVIDEMERRYKTLARVGVRNITGFNEWLAKDADKSWGEDAAPQALPFLVIVIDEYADLVLTLGSEVEEPIAKLAQMARAVGIHLVVATQRPSVDVITGVIKANFPSRIAFQVASKVDSRTILDINGAEQLLGKGDMLFLKTGRPESERVHGAYISTDETAAIADFIKEQCFAVEHVGIDVPHPAEPEKPFDGNAEDELFEDAVKLVVRHQSASVSMIQRRLKVGFSRAGRLMDIMERAGIVGPFEGSKAREVYLKPGEMAHAADDDGR